MKKVLWGFLILSAVAGRRLAMADGQTGVAMGVTLSPTATPTATPTPQTCSPIQQTILTKGSSCQGKP